MSSLRDRQRANKRAKLVQEMAERAEAARRKRVLRARVGAGVGGGVVLALVIWLVVGLTTGGADSSEEVAAAAPTAASCVWYPVVDPSASPAPTLPAGRKDVGTPPASVPNSGYQVMTLESNLGTIKIEMDLAKAPCTAASFAHLASQKFLDDAGCHRLVPVISALQCGDPSGTGSGGPSYEFANEYLPTDRLPIYREGDVAMANGGEQAPNSNGSQFFFIYQNLKNELAPSYTLFGHVIEGLDVVKKVAEGGDDGAFEASAGGGHPKTEITFTSVTVGPVTAESVATGAPTTTAPTTADASPATATPNPNS